MNIVHALVNAVEILAQIRGNALRQTPFRPGTKRETERRLHIVRKGKETQEDRRQKYEPSTPIDSLSYAIRAWQT